MALPRTNRTVEVRRLVNVWWKKDYSDVITTWLKVYLNPPKWQASFEMQVDLEWGLEWFVMYTEFAWIEINDKIIDDNGREYKVYKIDLRDSWGIRPIFYELSLSSKNG